MKSELDIFDAIKNTGVDILKDYGDLGLAEITKIFDKELFADVPYISTIINLATFGTKVKGYFMAKKLLSFLSQLHSIPLEERQKFIKKLENSKESKKIGEKLIIVIDALDDDEKAIILGKLWKKTIEGNINMSDFLRLSNSINQIYLDDLKRFKVITSLNELNSDAISSLYKHGFLNITIDDVNRQVMKNHRSGFLKMAQPKLIYTKSELGELFLNNIDNV